MYCEWGSRAPACEDVEYASTNDTSLRDVRCSGKLNYCPYKIV